MSLILNDFLNVIVVYSLMLSMPMRGVPMKLNVCCVLRWNLIKALNDRCLMQEVSHPRVVAMLYLVQCILFDRYC